MGSYWGYCLGSRARWVSHAYSVACFTESAQLIPPCSARYRCCLRAWLCLQAIFPQGGRCGSIRWWRSDTNRKWKSEIRNWDKRSAMSWLSGLFGKQKREKELEEEVRSHLE